MIGLEVPMRDGVHLAADVYLPKEEGRWPAVLVRTPYNRKSFASRSYRYFLQRGYAVVLQDVRGRFASQGVFGPTEQEGPDGSDSINWIAQQPWSDGRVAMVGSSYLGLAQWWAVLQDNPHLVTISPMCSGDDEYLDRFYSPGGALKLGHRLLWLAQNMTPPSRTHPLFATFISHLPLKTADVAATGEALPVWREALKHPSYDSYWKSVSVREKVSRVKVPVFSLGGWFDNYAEGDLDMFTRLSRQHTPVETWIGPWAHDPGLKFPTRDFGTGARLPFRRLQGDWFDRWFGRSDVNSEKELLPALHIFVMGPNVWREEHEWPLARTQFTSFYLTSKGHANSFSGNGELGKQPVAKSPADTFVYDPRSPVPTVGGSICCDPVLMAPGPLDQTPVEVRPDVLVYTSAPLRDPVEVTGPVRATLYVETSANDTDFTAKLVDVQQNGRPLVVADGLQRLRYRNSLVKPSFVKRNAPYQITVDAGVTSYVFASGHRIRLEVSSSNFPRYDRNLNSNGANADAAKPLKARQVVLHDRRYPSALILPVIPQEAPSNLPTARENGTRVSAGPPSLLLSQAPRK